MLAANNFLLYQREGNFKWIIDWLAGSSACAQEMLDNRPDWGIAVTMPARYRHSNGPFRHWSVPHGLRTGLLLAILIACFSQLSGR